MHKQTVCIIGLDRPEFEALRKHYPGPVLYHEVVPQILVKEGLLFVSRPNGVGMVQVDKVVYHAIFEDDFDLITGLAIWGGPSYPNAMGMQDCRLKLPCLARALKHSRFNSPRGFASPHTEVPAEQMTVAKWGNWHCGENKERFTGTWSSEHPAVIEPFFEGEAVRIVIIGERSWQIRLEGEDWLKSIHSEKADFMEIDPELLEDGRSLQQAFGLQMIGVDYIAGPNGQHHLLEVNHIPNVTRFDALRSAFIEDAARWING